jgi:hypothetical protein
MLLRTSVALALAVASCAALAQTSLAPPPPRKKTFPGETWSAFFALNSTDNCATDVVGAVFTVARWATNSTVPTSVQGNYSLSFPDIFPGLDPIHSKSLTGYGSVMATDSLGRRGWAMMGTTDWTPHVWIVALSFPGGPSTPAVATGVCELLNISYGTLVITGSLNYDPLISKQGPWFLWGAQYGQGNNSISTVSVPALKPGSTTIPLCGVTNVSGISDPAFSPFTIPAPAIGTTASGSPVLMALSTSQTNTSQTNLTVWSALTGQRVYGPTTLACGYPSYLYQCPPTTGANWPMQGLFGFSMTNGTLIIGGGDRSSQQYFMGVIPLKEDGEEEEGEGAGIPTLTFLNSSANQGQWLGGPQTSVFAPKQGKFPITVQYLGGYGGQCVGPNSASMVIMSIPYANGTLVNTTLAGSSLASGCPLIPGSLPWYSSAVCAGASMGYPDLVTGTHS